MEKATLGILGGMGPEATEIYYKKIIDHTEVNCDQDHLNVMIYSHASIPDRTESLACGQSEKLWGILKKDIDMLKEMGCKYLTIPCNTCHYYGDRLSKEMGGHFINMIEETALYCKMRGLQKVGVLATDGTVHYNLYQKALDQYGIETYYPSSDKQKIVMSIIYDQIKRGEKGDKHQFMDVIEELRKADCQAAILACTELSVFNMNYQLSNDYYIDAMDVVTRACIEKCGGKYCD